MRINIIVNSICIVDDNIMFIWIYEVLIKKETLGAINKRVLNDSV